MHGQQIVIITKGLNGDGERKAKIASVYGTGKTVWLTLYKRPYSVLFAAGMVSRSQICTLYIVYIHSLRWSRFYTLACMCTIIYKLST